MRGGVSEWDNLKPCGRASVRERVSLRHAGFGMVVFGGSKLRLEGLA